MLNDDNTCAIYENRLGFPVNQILGYKCSMRSETAYDFEDCPYNTIKEVKNWK